MKLNQDQKKHLYRYNHQDIVNAFKMMGNEYRMNIIITMKNHPGITLEQINEHVGGDFKNIHVHVKKLFTAKLLEKKYKGRLVQHWLSEYGKVALKAYELFTKDPYR